MAAQRTRVSAAALVDATGRDWDQWNALIDAWGGTGHPHGAIVAWLTGGHGVDNWWAQTIAVGYEQARGLRTAGSGRDGLFTVSASRTLAVPLDKLYAAFLDPALRERWLPDGTLRERTAQPQRTARFDWDDGTTRVNVGFTAKGAGRSQVALAHERLPDSAAADRERAGWRTRLDALKAMLEGDGA